MKIIVASKNDHKVKELSQMLNMEGLEFVSLKDMGFEGDIEENGTSFEENALIKAEAVCKKYRICAIADDSGLCVDFLDGAPGIYSARYASKDGENADDLANVDKLLDNLKGVKWADRTAYFACAMALVCPDGVKKTVLGTCHGYITEAMHGDGGFGYDPVFYYEPFGKTFGETSQEMKNTVSHRFQAVKQMKKELLSIFHV